MSFSDVNPKKCFHCVDCGRRLVKLRKNLDWITRTKHKKCWKKFNKLGFSMDGHFDFFTGEQITK
jgi:hypothetical protein